MLNYVNDKINSFNYNANANTNNSFRSSSIRFNNSIIGLLCIIIIVVLF